MTREEEIEKAIEEEFEDHLFEDECDYIMQSSKFKKGILWADQHPREGLWDAEKVITWIALHAELYGGFNQGKLNSMCEDLRKAMED